jgi:hydroxymethylpyrimidine pyrophosphatase-like HAD family hydrolase
MNVTTTFQALATDYDGTIAQHGDVPGSTREALERWKETGRKLLLVTGRELHDLANVCSFTNLFDCIVVENGAVLHWPISGNTRTLAAAPPIHFLDCLRAQGVTPLSIGEVIVATLENYRAVVLETICDLGLNLNVISNKGAVMVLPVGVDKATGLRAALRELAIPAEAVVAVGDAENDETFLALCGFSAAVGNALDFLKNKVHYVANATHGAGVEELISKVDQALRLSQTFLTANEHE